MVIGKPGVVSFTTSTTYLFEGLKNVNNLKAFAHIGPLVNNTQGVVAPVGELSAMALTFTRIKSLHTHSDFANLMLVTFSYKVDDVPTPVSDPIAYSNLTALAWTYDRARLGAFDATKDSFQQAFILNFGSTFDLISSGEMVGFDNHYIPEYIEFAPKNQSATISWRIWFANDSFYNQFDEHEILVVPPVANIDAFFNDTQTVSDLIASIKAADLIAKADVIKGAYPYTVFRDDLFDWVDPLDRDIRIPVDWPVIVYGLAGDNLDAVKEAIRTWILANSTHTRDEWAEIFPDLFTSTEFIITPMWHRYAIPNATRDLGVFASVIPMTSVYPLVHDSCKGVGYTNAHIDEVLCMMPSLFRSVQLAVVGGPENRNGIDRLDERYPDIINVPSTHVDFMRMSEETRQFILLLNEMLDHAEELTPNSGVPQGFNRQTREGVVYLSRTFKNFLYLVVTKYSVDALTA